ncbi:tRNA pseudouridine(38-40) synthase TruA [Pelagibacterium sp.]|uniref:tRNA pseudouridine(38-40) synthase TruA n=1 Tax=Pelagibacterium sp. TaxID=1967288 RepID=UPI003BAB7846
MPRYKLTIEYDGTPFVGWQRQADALSVQEALETAIEAFSGEAVRTQTAGRTDAGVHARGQVAHFDLEREWDPFRVSEALNFHLKPHPIVILNCEAVGEDFEARFSAKARHYRYVILNRRARPSLDVDKVWHVAVPLDEKAMHAAAQTILGRHDFTTFRSAQCQANSPLRTLDRLDVRREDDLVIIEASARAFLHHQVRSMTGSLKLVGEGRWPVSDLRAALDAKDRSRCGAMAPSSGLYLMAIDY